MDTTDPVVVEQTFNVPIETVWQAITDKDQMRQWFFDTMVDFEPKIGFETEFNVRCEERDFPHQWKITEVVPNRRIAYQWQYGGYPGTSLVTWELSEHPTGTTLKLTHEGHETFPQNDPMFNRAAGQAGWEYLLGDSLKGFLE